MQTRTVSFHISMQYLCLWTMTLRSRVPFFALNLLCYRTRSRRI